MEWVKSPLLFESLTWVGLGPFELAIAGSGPHTTHGGEEEVEAATNVMQPDVELESPVLPKGAALVICQGTSGGGKEGNEGE